MLPLLLACAGPADTGADDTADPFVPPDPPADGVRIHVPAVALDPGEERERCLYLPAVTDTDTWITGIELVARDGLHHAMLVKSDGTRDGEEACFGIPEDVMGDYTNVPEPVFASSTQVTEESVSFPEGVGVPLAAGQAWMVNYHLINPSTEVATGEVFIDLHLADATVDLEPARLYAMGAIVGIDVPAQGEQTLSTTCTFPCDANLLSLTPHMHQRGRAFAASAIVGGSEQSLLTTTEWESPETEWFDPNVAVSAGDSLRFSCSWVNDGDEAVGFGASADDEMCMVFGYHWPADDMLWRANYDEEACVSE